MAHIPKNSHLTSLEPVPWQLSLIQYEPHCLFLFVASGPTCWAISQTSISFRPDTSSEPPVFFEIDISGRNDEWHSSNGTDRKQTGIFEKRGLRLERTSLQQGGLYVKKQNPTPSESVQQPPPAALLTLHVNVPLFLQCVSLHTYWALEKEII